MARENVSQVIGSSPFLQKHSDIIRIWHWTTFLILAASMITVLIELTLPGEEKIRTRIKNAMGLVKLNDENKVKYKHYINVKRVYLLFYLILFLMALTGLGLAFGRDLGFSREIHHTVKTIHSLLQYCMYAFVVIHLGGVIIAENSKNNGIISGMINGNSPLKQAN
jgi:Ni,Fe-hydrogenase I cytochrome b subunit